MNTNNGTVKFFNVTKGFGFIVDNNSQEEFFVHISECAPGYTPNDGDVVGFNVGQGKKGTMATHVQRAD